MENFARYDKDIQSYSLIWQNNGKYGLILPSYPKFWPFFESICPLMAKLYEVMTKYDQIVQIYTIYGQIWQISEKL